MIVDVLVPEIKRLVICARTLALKDHTHNSVFLSLLFYFYWRYYNKWFVRYLKIKSSLVLITNYSID